MTKNELVKSINEKTGVSKSDALIIVESLMEIIKDDMVKGEEIFLRGFGSFILKKKAAKTARNISKNTSIIIPESIVPAFKPSLEFKKMLSNTK